MNTSEVLISMLTQNVGTNILDSGGTPRYDENGNYIGSAYGYGRNFERNQYRNFETELATGVSFRHGKINVVHNVYHWLKDRLEFNEELNTLFHVDFKEEKDSDNYKSWLELMAEFPEWLGKHMTEKEENDSYENPGGIYGEGEPITVNTCNDEDLLSQTIQFHYWTCKAGEFVALQIHGGADVRGGYTSPRIFSVNGNSELAMLEYDKASIYCTGKNHHPNAIAIKEMQEKQAKLPGIKTNEIDFEEQHYWYSNGGGIEWGYQESWGKGAGKQLEKYETKDLNEDDEEKPGEWEAGKLCYKDEVGYCPICGARLAAGS
jgi:hypothetical protein